MVVTIYGLNGSTCTKRVLMTCHELGVKYELNKIDLFKAEHKAPEYIANLQPFGAVPVLIDEDGTQLFESRAIARYLVAKYGKDSTLMPSPSDPRAYGLFEQAASIEYSTFDQLAHCGVFFT
ncbi:unnamed protein product [Rhizoctonia solani]|uniref:GST N-terminal domain-containing protein n=1 Tax=Rhizoctonia solani TaxID=456999 RepID=A0A8H3AUI9_9AGAM|nr:unnamed protein product [Rhizoctonia solani]